MRTRSGTVALIAASAAALLLASPATPQASDEPLQELWSEYPLYPERGDEGPTGEEREQRTAPAGGAPGRAHARAAAAGDESTSSQPGGLMLLLVIVGVGVSAAVTAFILASAARGLVLSAVSAQARVLPRAASLVGAVRESALSAVAAVAGAPARLRRAAAPATTAVRGSAVPFARVAAATPVRPLAPSGRIRERASGREPVESEPRAPESLVAPAAEAAATTEQAARGADASPPTAVESQTEYCVIRWWRGYVKAQFHAVVVHSNGDEHIAATSPLFRWRAAAPPSPERDVVRAAYEELVETLEIDGWKRVDPNEPLRDEIPSRATLWYEARFCRRVPLSLRDLADHLNDPRRRPESHG